MDALFRLHFAAGNAVWLRDALDRHDGSDPAQAAESLLSDRSQDGAAPLLSHDARALANGAQAHAHARSVRDWLAGGDARHVLAWGSPGYPSLLRETPSPPTLLYVEGQAERLWWPQIAIVGSRAPTPAGRDRAGRWARAFADAGFMVTSGLASGIDAAAHAASLDGTGTIAVTATGPDRCYPAAHRGLHAAILPRGALVTEHAPGVDPRPEHFPSRNRIIAGLSLATVVIEAAHRSGALITARLAADAGREVFALPGSPENPKARGCHRLIRDGATLVDEPAQVLEALTGSASVVADRLRTMLSTPRSAPIGDLFSGGASDSKPVGVTHRTGPTDPVLQSLGHEGARFDELLARTGLTPAALAPILLAMELEGRLTQQHGVYLPCGSAPPTRAGHQRRR